MVVVPPTVKASGLVRDAVAKAIGKIDADKILEERVELEAVDLCYRPVYAFRYRRMGKEAVVEVDGLTGEVSTTGSTFEEHLGKILEPQLPARYRGRGGQHLHSRRDGGQARHRQEPGAAPQRREGRGREANVKRPAKPKRRRLSPAEKARIAEIFRAVRGGLPRSAHRARLQDAVHAAGGGGAVGAGHRQVGEQGDRAALRGRRHAAEMLALGEAGLIPYIASIGLFRMKAKNVVALSRILIEQYGGEVPLQRDKLQALPGVGRKTASVVLNELGVEPAIAVDTHVFRVAHRLRLSKGKTPDDVERDLMAIVPDDATRPAPTTG